jgi:hypothetical protein
MGGQNHPQQQPGTSQPPIFTFRQIGKFPMKTGGKWGLIRRADDQDGVPRDQDLEAPGD